MFVKVYLYFMLIMTLVFNLDLLRNEFFEGMDSLFLVNDCFVLLGLYGYAYNKKYLQPDFWKVFVLISITMVLYQFYWLYEDIVTELSEDISLLIISFAIIISAPSYYFLNKYRQVINKQR